MLNTLVNTCTQSIQFCSCTKLSWCRSYSRNSSFLEQICSCAQEHAKTWEGKHPFAMPFLWAANCSDYNTSLSSNTMENGLINLYETLLIGNPSKLSLLDSSVLRLNKEKFVLRSQTLRCRASVFNIWYLFCTQNWSLYFNLLTSGVDFARIRRVFGLSSQNRFLFGLLPITEGKSLGSALLPRISNITEKLLYKSGAFWLWFCRNLSLVTGLEKKN